MKNEFKTNSHDVDCYLTNGMYRKSQTRDLHKIITKTQKKTLQEHINDVFVKR